LPFRIFKSIFIYLIALGDLVLIIGGFFAAFKLRFSGIVPGANWEPFTQITPWVCLATLILFSGLGLYQLRQHEFTALMRRVITGILAVFISTIAITFWVRGFAFPRSVLVLAIPIQALLVCIWRYLCWYLQRWLYGRKKVLVVGSPAEVMKILGKLFDLPRGWFEVRDLLAPEDLGRLPSLLPSMDAVLVVPSLSRQDKANVLSACLKARREAYLIPDLYDIMLSHGNLQQLNDLPVIEIQELRLTWPQKITKQTFDLAVSGVGLVLGSLLFLGCALAVVLTSPGPVFYTQERVGYRGRPFLLYKFRTMVKDAEKITGPILAKENDHRITPVGRILRSTRLDELPQLINVLKGNMSIVGPRPERPYFINQFIKETPNYHYRHLVKPGLTGLAQVYSKYSTSAVDKLRYDLYYIRNYSLWLDLKIILQTIPLVLGGESSQGLKEQTDLEKQEAIHTLVNSIHQTASGKES
jgi:exopolysaccharide biosynthesis polyprenyl glycosylphosphotransferase